MNYISVTNTIHRDPLLVERCLQALLSQKIKPYKVYLIDQNENEINLSNQIIDNPMFQRNKVSFKSVSAARNSILIPAGVQWIFFCDDDGYACEDYSEILDDLIVKNPKLEIFAGSIIREDTLEFYSLRHKKGGSLTKFRNTKNLMGSNFVVKASAFNKLKRFDENFGVGSYWGSSEETDFCWNAFFEKIKMGFFHELKVYHVAPFNESLKTGFLKSFNYGIGKGALVFKWLIKKRRFVVIYELGEMFILPFLLSLLGLIKLKPQLVATNFAAFAGRFYGFVKAFIVNRN